MYNKELLKGVNWFHRELTKPTLLERLRRFKYNRNTVMSADITPYLYLLPKIIEPQKIQSIPEQENDN